METKVDGGDGGGSGNEAEGKSGELHIEDWWKKDGIICGCCKMDEEIEVMMEKLWGDSEGFLYSDLRSMRVDP